MRPFSLHGPYRPVGSGFLVKFEIPQALESFPGQALATSVSHAHAVAACLRLAPASTSENEKTLKDPTYEGLSFGPWASRPWMISRVPMVSLMSQGLADLSESVASAGIRCTAHAGVVFAFVV